MFSMLENLLGELGRANPFFTLILLVAILSAVVQVFSHRAPDHSTPAPVSRSREAVELSSPPVEPTRTSRYSPRPPRGTVGSLAGMWSCVEPGTRRETKFFVFQNDGIVITSRTNSERASYRLEDGILSLLANRGSPETILQRGRIEWRNGDQFNYRVISLGPARGQACDCHRQ